MIRVLVVDDSATVRRLLSEELDAQPGIMAVATAADPYEARERIVADAPDVVTLDIEMPGMDGLTFLERLMASRPLPVVVISSLTSRGSEAAMRALELGAVEVLCKPGVDYPRDQLGQVLGRAVRAAALARPRASALVPRVETARWSPSPRGGALLAIGASTGGPQAVARLLSALPADGPPTVIVQHLPRLFTASFAQRLDQCSRMTVAEARGGEELRAGEAWVAPGGRHLLVVRDSARLVLGIGDGPAEHFQRPSVDVTFRGVAAACGSASVGVLLTGMGSDGADGLLAMRRAGARTFAQDEESSVVYGMPRAAVENGAAETVAPLARLPERIIAALSRIRA
jgi:two-component system chemotaxis response regulator CheB